jgi:hypothetical protein
VFLHGAALTTPGAGSGVGALAVAGGVLLAVATLAGALGHGFLLIAERGME